MTNLETEPLEGKSRRPTACTGRSGGFRSGFHAATGVRIVNDRRLVNGQPPLHGVDLPFIFKGGFNIGF
jgi:hypothetical protein